MLIIDGVSQPTDFQRTGGRLWIPSGHMTGEGDATFSDALVCCPLGKYIFVKPQGAYSASQFIDLRDVTEGYGTYAQITGYIFWVGDSSSCGGTVIAHNTSDPMQKFLRDPAVSTEFHMASITRGGFFLLGNRQGAGVTAGEIKKIVFDGQLDFLVLGVHQLPGEEPELPVVALRHLIASIRWDFGARIPILLLMADDSPNHHLIRESDRDSFNSNEWDASPEGGGPPALSAFPGTPLLLGDITDQADIAADGSAASQNAAEVAVLDRTGDLGLNWWPVMAFVPNSAGGKAVETTLMGMGGDEQAHKAFYHPLLVPMADSGCPFNTNRALSSAEFSRAETLFESTLLLSHLPASDVTNRTTSVWFWDYASVKNSTPVRSWTIPSGRLDATEDNLSFVSDTSVVWESTPRWVSHPLVGREFAIEFALKERSANTAVRWFGKHFPKDKFGNVPLLLGAGDVEEGWITSIVPFALSPTASDYQAYLSQIPDIPPWVKFSWVFPDNPNIVFDPDLGDLGDFIEEATSYMSTRVAGGQPRDIDPMGDCEGGDDKGKRWSFGLNQPSVVLYGTVCDGVYQETDTFLDLRIAPFAVHAQARNLRMGRTMPNGEKTSIVWPGKLFYITPILLPMGWDMFKPSAAFNVPLGFWSGQGFKFGNAMGTPLLIDAMQRENAHIQAGILPTKIDIIMEYPAAKGDFPPMMDAYDEKLSRGLANHFARVDIAPGTASRSTEGGHVGGGGGVPRACENAKSMAWGWPIRDNHTILVTNGFTALPSPGQTGCCHCAIDLVYKGANVEGTDILAVGDGTIKTRSYCPPCGNYIEIEHLVPPFPSTTSVISRYLHMNNPSDRRVGETVRRGDVIGKVGGMGAPGGAVHLHFAMYCNTVGDCETTGIDSCGILPAPASGACYYKGRYACENSECGASYCDGCGDTDVEGVIRFMFSAAIEAAGDTPYILTPNGLFLRENVAVAVATAESGLRREAQNCIIIAGVKYSHVGLFQIQNPTHINNDVAAGNISTASVITNDPACPGIRIAQDYKQIRSNISAAIRISGNGANWGQWTTYTGGAYLKYMP